MNSTKELKNVTITLDENQICVLHTMLNTLFFEHPVETSRTDMKEIRQIVNAAVRRAVG